MDCSNIVSDVIEMVRGYGIESKPYHDTGKIEMVNIPTSESGRARKEEDNAGGVIKLPSKYVLWNSSSGDILFSPEKDLLMCNIDKLCEMNIGVINDGGDDCTVSIIKRVSKPKGITFKRNGDFYINSSQFYDNTWYSSFYLFNKETRMFYRGFRDLMFMRRYTLAEHNWDNDVLAVSLCSLEQAACYWSIEIRDGGYSVIMPTTQDAVMEILSIRDGPIANKRKSAILHWVKRHYRDCPSKSVPVSAHLRGVESVEIDGATVIVSPPLSCLIESKKITKSIDSFSYYIYNALNKGEE